MAVGFTQDGAVQDQIDDTVLDAVTAARSALTGTNTTDYCLECDELIPQARRDARNGVELCIQCQSVAESAARSTGMNRRASKDALLR